MKSIVSRLWFLIILNSCNGDLLFTPIAPEVPQQPATPPTWEEVANRGIWLVGGQQGNYPSANVIAQIDVFDPVTLTWYPNVTTLPTPVTFAGVTAYQGKLYVAGGFNSTGVNVNTLQIYDVATNTWSTGTNMSTVRANFDLIPSSGFLYATAGTNAANQGAAFANVSNWLFYNTSTNIWSGPTAYATYYESGQALLVYGLIHHLGGRSAAATLANVHLGFIPVTPPTVPTETSTTAEIAISRVGAAVGFYANNFGTGYILVAGGISANLAGAPTAYIFNGNTANQTIMTNGIFYLRAPFEAPAAWTATSAALPFPVAMIQGVVAEHKFFLFGGTKSLPTPSATNEAWVMDLKGFPNAPTNVVALQPMPIARYGHKAVRMIQ